LEKFDSFIFTHIPKCGGTSFRKLINDAAADSGIDKKDIYIPGFNGLGNNKNIDQLDEAEVEKFKSGSYKVIAAHSKFNVHKNYNLDILNPFYYTILRDPVKRFISHYYFFYFKLGYDNLKGVHLDDLASEKLLTLVQRLANIQTTYLANFKFRKVIGEENLLKLAKYNLQYEYGEFGILEEFEKSILSLIDKAPKWLKNIKKLPELNRTFSNNQEVSEEVLKIIKMNNQLDYELFDFGQKVQTARMISFTDTV